MDYRPEDSKSLYDYSDKSVQHAGYAAAAYAASICSVAFLPLFSISFITGPGRAVLSAMTLSRSSIFSTLRYSRRFLWHSALSSRLFPASSHFSSSVPADSRWSPWLRSSLCSSSSPGSSRILSRAALSALSSPLFCSAVHAVFFRIIQSVSSMRRKRSDHARGCVKSPEAKNRALENDL
jgi:hypothetical protein